MDDDGLCSNCRAFHATDMESTEAPPPSAPVPRGPTPAGEQVLASLAAVYARCHAAANDLQPLQAVHGRRVGRQFIRYASRVQPPFATTRAADTLAAAVELLSDDLAALPKSGSKKKAKAPLLQCIKVVAAALRESPCVAEDATRLVLAMEAVVGSDARIIADLSEVRDALRLGGDRLGSARSATIVAAANASAEHLYGAIAEPLAARSGEACRKRVEKALCASKKLKGVSVSIFGSAVSGFGLKSSAQLLSSGGAAKKKKGGRGKRAKKKKHVGAVVTTNSKDVDLCVRVQSALVSASRFELTSAAARKRLAAAAAEWPNVARARSHREACEAALERSQKKADHLEFHSGGRSKRQAVAKQEAALAHLQAQSVVDAEAVRHAAQALSRARARIKPWSDEVDAARAIEADGAVEFSEAQERESAALGAAYSTAQDDLEPAATRADFDRTVNREFVEPLNLLISTAVQQKRTADTVIQNIARALRGGRCGSFDGVRAITGARVPLVKAMDVAAERAVDVIVNRELGVRNSLLLRAYAELDRRAHALGLIVKAWAKARNLADASKGFLSSCVCASAHVFRPLSTPLVSIAPRSHAVRVCSPPTSAATAGCAWRSTTRRRVASSPRCKTTRSALRRSWWTAKGGRLTSPSAPTNTLHARTLRRCVLLRTTGLTAATR